MAGPSGLLTMCPLRAETHAGQFVQRLALGVVHDLVVELAAHDEVDRLGAEQGLIRFGGHRRSDERHLQFRVDVLHHLRHFHVDVKTRSRSIEHEQFEILAHLDGLFDRDLVRRRVHNLAVGQHSRGIAEPYRIPVRLDFARRRPARTGAAIEAFKRRRIQKQCSHAISRGTGGRSIGRPLRRPTLRFERRWKSC